MSLQLTMRALSDPSRREILNLLKKDPMTATSIAEHFDMSAPAVSKHLNILKGLTLLHHSLQLFYLLVYNVLLPKWL